MDRVAGARRRTIAPEQKNYAVGGYHLIAIDQQNNKQRAELCPREDEGIASFAFNLKPTQYTKPHRISPLAGQGLYKDARRPIVLLFAVRINIAPRQAYRCNSIVEHDRPTLHISR